MSKIKFHFTNVRKYVQGKSPIELAVEVFAFGFLLPLVVFGITSIIFSLITGEINTNNISFGIYG